MALPEHVTPPPWKAVMVAGLCCVLEEAKRSQVAGYTRPANAYLIAAAPDLYAVVERFINLYGAGGPESAFDDLYTQAERAIAKAYGEGHENLK